MTLKGYTHFDSSTGLFDLVFWVEDAGVVVTSGLGSLNYQIYDRNGNAIAGSGAAGSSISPNAQGLYTVADISNPTFLNNRETYLLYAETTKDAAPVSTYLPFTLTIV